MADALSLMIRSGNPLVSIETTDEERALQYVRNAAAETNRPLWTWSMTAGLREHSGGEKAGKTVLPPGKAASVLQHIRQSGHGGVYLFHDLGPHCKDAQVHRLLRDLMATCPETRTTLILVDALPIPQEVKRFAVRYEIGWPDAEELEEVVKATFRRIRDESLYEVKATITRQDMEQLVQILRGLSRSEAERVVASAIYDDYSLTREDLSKVVELKRSLLGGSGCLEAIAADFRPEDIGGLQNLKGWLRRRRGGFGRDATEFGLEPPRGVLMLGVQGCGKSLCAKVVAADWQMPLLRLDPGVLYQKFIGESESRLRESLGQAEAMAPVVLWIDEIEKAFASAGTSGTADGGLSQRMFGTLLSWMQDHRHPIFIVATANDVSSLPPELMRKGRFDEVFFVDLPSDEARQQILEIHLRRRNRKIEEFDLAELAAHAPEFSGAELEQAVVSAMYSAFSEKQTLQTRHILTELQRTRPLAVLAKERIARLRDWARDRCVAAD